MFDRVFGMLSADMAIDLGTANTLVGLPPISGPALKLEFGAV